MKSFSLKRCVLSGSVALALLAACSGGVLTNGGSSLGVAPAAPAQRDTRGALLYVAALGAPAVYVFTYPGGVLQQALQYFDSPGGECVDGKGNVFVTDTSGDDIVEFAHGGNAPIATLTDPGDYPEGCSVDPTTGNLAVTNGDQVDGDVGEVVLYAHARGAAQKTYTDSQIDNMWSCAYDTKGNLFVDGNYNNGAPIFLELPRGAKTFTRLTLDRAFKTLGSILWNGTYLAIGDPKTSTIYRFAFSGSKGTLKGTTHLDGAPSLEQFWIDGSDVAAANGSLHEWAGVWMYPGGGKPVVRNKNLCKSNYCLSVGATISQ